ncbi:hypothetical protein PspLS_08890 [Pyricularia sp. CBS 133598]|nr:hypothetical protein PspLS_08890 [Pyricularia sp. CBS 133598]
MTRVSHLIAQSQTQNIRGVAARFLLPRNFSMAAQYPGNRMRDPIPMNEPLTAPWDIRISKKDVEKLMIGFESDDMDEQWDVLIENPDKNDNKTISIHFMRSWTGDEIYILHLDHDPDQQGSQEGRTRVHSITWEGNMNDVCIDAEQAQKEVVLLARNLLYCKFEELPHYDHAEVYSHPAYFLNRQEEPTS